MIKEMKGDLLSVKKGYLAHVVSCTGFMIGGLAEQIKDKLLTEDQYEHYQVLCERNSADFLLGTWWGYYTSDVDLIVAIMFAEDVRREEGRTTDYTSLKRCLEDLKLSVGIGHSSLSIPGYLGCGFGGGDWNYVLKYIITPLFKDFSNGLYIYYTHENVKRLWNDFNSVYINPDTRCIEHEWHGFPKGTQREEIWLWFERTFKLSVAEELNI